MKKISLMLVCLCAAALAGDENGKNPIQPKLETTIDLKNYKKLEKKENTIHFDQNGSSTNGIYNYVYSPLSKDTPKQPNVFLNGFFDKIERFDPLYFQDGKLDRDSNETLNRIVRKIKYYAAKEHGGVAVTIIGYTQSVEENKTKVELENAFANFIQNLFQRDGEDPKKAKKQVHHHMQLVYKTLLENNISKNIIYKESRVGKDPLYTEATREGRDKNNRVEVAIYVKSFIDPDSDKDGVRDSKDYCPNTPVGASVDKNGCPRLMTLDIKFDFDKATISDKKSLEAIDKLIEFMKKYPAYHAHIVGNTDSTGPEEYNLELSKRRAEAVVKRMEKAGIDPKRLSFEGKGESEPLVENSNPFNRHLNRRTEVELTLPEKSLQDRPNPESRRIGER